MTGLDRPMLGPLTRRAALALGASFAVAGPAEALAPGLFAVPALSSQARRRFSGKTVVDIARQLSERPFVAPPATPERFRTLSYSQYRAIRYRKDRAIWRGEGVGFELELFAPGSVFNTPVAIDLVQRGISRPLAFDPELFDWGEAAPTREEAARLGFTGFRVHSPLNRADYLDEFAVFQGASYFRGVAKGQAYGLSARGLAINTAQAAGEEFPIFRKFWVERPTAGAGALVAHALLDSPSVAGAYRFGLYPGEVTAMEVSATLFPRRALTHVGLGPLTSMYFFGWLGRQGVDDFRPEVHDSDGLAILTGRGESIWRPLANPRTLQASAFVDENPKGFGLLQRARTLDRYQDLEANYERRPSLWVEPQGAWGRGWVELIEIPTDSEVNDNIVAYWRPEAPIRAGRPFELAYKLSWCAEAPGAAPLARVTQSRSGKRESGARLFVIDYEGGPLAGLQGLDGVTVEASASAGRIDNIVRQPLPGGRGVRVSFDLDVGDAPLIELRVVPWQGRAAAGETWLYRWTA